MIPLLLAMVGSLLGKEPEQTWRSLLEKHADCVTWVSVTVRIEVARAEEACPHKSKNWRRLVPSFPTDSPSYP